MQFTYYGQSCFNINFKTYNLLFDPFISKNELAKEIDIDKIEADYILISHGHFDHIDDAVSIAKRTGAKVICNFEVGSWLEKQGVENIHQMNTGGKWKFEFGTVKCVNAIHSSSMPDGTYGGSAIGFILSSDEKNIYYAGDTALTMDMQLIAMQYSIDLCILPVGDNFTMGYEDAVEAAKMVKTKKAIGVHFDTFGFIKIDHQKVKSYFSENNIDLTLPKIGETIEI
ncbi:MAG: metal-dependent hydrolase [Ferruginibacter sp.]